MDFQPRSYKAQAESKFFEDGHGMRMPVKGTVARNRLGVHLGDRAIEGKIAREIAASAHVAWLNSVDADDVKNSSVMP